MVEADEGNSWIYKNKDHGGCVLLLFRVSPDNYFRNDECGGFPRVKFAMGYRCWIESCRQIHLLSRRAHQGKFTMLRKL